MILALMTYADADALRVLPDNARDTVLSAMDCILDQPCGPDHGDFETLEDMELRLERRFGVSLPPLDRIVEDAWLRMNPE